ncbi:hypothetical protein [Microbacterium resistens]|uniref:hypothetical protein n=1 Tax=Microbacterium resistens TaxID=156977 RepID=UPI00366F96F6
MPVLSLGADLVTRDLLPMTQEALDKRYAPRFEGPIETLPGWIVGTTATFRPPVFNRESPALLEIRRRVIAAVLGRDSCEILVTADSKGSNFQGLVMGWPEQVRRSLAAADGFVQADDGLMDPRWTLVGMQLAPTTSIGVRPATTGTTDPKSAQFATLDGFAGGTLWARLPGGGPATLSIDGTATAVTIPATAGFHPIPLGTLPPNPHTVKLEATGDLYVSGITLTYDTPMLRISNPARPSSAASDWSGTSPTGRFATVVDGPATSPDVIISALGTNEITNLNALTVYYDQLAALGVPVIIISPGGIDGNRGLEPTHALAAHLYQIAQQHDWPLIDEEQVIGLYAQANAHQLMLDGLHGNTRASALLAMVVVALIAGAIA